MPTAVRSHAKINLGLYIGAPRPDGFHALSTVYQTLELHDVVTVTAQRAATTVIRISSNDSRVPCDVRNTAWKMVALAVDALGITAQVQIDIDKRLPVQGGMGAGSANALAALIGLETELGISPAHQGEAVGTRSLTNTPNPGGRDWYLNKLEIAAKVGSDVPLFLIGGAVLGLDRGQQVEPLPDFEPVWCVIATPSIGVSTPQAFRDWDALCAAEGLTQNASQAKLNELSRAFVSAFERITSQGGQGTGSSGVLSLREDRAGPKESALVRTGILTWVENDFERVVFPQYPSLAEIKRILLSKGTPEEALLAMLSGSGSALFGLYKAREHAEAARERLLATGVSSHLTRTIPRQAYWAEMLLQDGH